MAAHLRYQLAKNSDLHGIRFLVALPPVRDLLLCAKHLFVAAMVVAIVPAGAQKMSNRNSSALNSEQGLASIPMVQGGLSRLAVARLKGAGVPVAPRLKRVGPRPELIAGPEERLSVQSQIRLLSSKRVGACGLKGLSQQCPLPSPAPSSAQDFPA